MAITGDQPPLDYMTADGQPVGFNTAILAEIRKRLQKNIELVSIESGARSVALSSGEVDMVFWTRGSEEGLPPKEDSQPENPPENAEERPELPEGANLEVLDKIKAKDITEGMIATRPYYTDVQVMITWDK